MDNRTEVLIVGAGVGGLTLALALHNEGIACRIIEAASSLEEIGAGINLQPHAVDVLDRLGLGSALAARAAPISELRFFSRHGQLIHVQPRGRQAGFDHPQYAIHRARLQSMLLDAVRARLGDARLELGVRCLHADETQAGVSVVTGHVDGSRQQRTVRALVGCDGIHSRVRALLHAGSDLPRYSGVTMWRGVGRAPSFLGGTAMILAGSLDAGKLVIYPLDPTSGEDERLVNWVAEKRVANMSRQDWSAHGDATELAWVDREWGIPELDAPSLVHQTARILRYPMVDKDPLPFWSRGRITLLGDAAHPMYPFGSNGACQAILDAKTLAECLAANGDIEQALLDYERQRLPATRDVVLLNRECAPDAILDVVEHRSGGLRFQEIDDVMTSDERMSLLSRYARVTGAIKDVLLDSVPAATVMSW
ncbi:FAD-dependent monooxygenase [Burkholderia ubonensis]|uniref:FAD-dependent monooxygenase n=1 Tax=Burkholderia ubonensis TaxID=101571 RepID=UPI0007C7E4A7|nr:FAD-dependent monooxygenase [Burkholderia ubonensis]